ncbi:MAG: hypothetical protein ACRD1H_16085 [Vicinamibacterales bacterium]
MDIFTFLLLILVGYLGTMAVALSLLWAGIKIWQRVFGKPAAPPPGDDLLSARHKRVGQDVAAEHAAQALRSHPGPLVPPDI